MLLNRMTIKQGVIVGAVGFVLVFALGLNIGQKPTALVVVDLTRAIQKPSLMLAHSKLSKDAQSKLMKQFSALLPQVIKAYGQTHRVTVMSATVLASNNSLDVTDKVVAETITRMKHEA
ncbi:TrbI F-type domain-containing protein [Legionella drozanskii]|uniref:Putative TrbI protein n=1 Tax=Legionella drozanskii LLAP-1 TaxID=1212489 RepID=A0A0W0SWB2_9GAMM|nr:TrbI F-type domain-containing protein [Legionella drozanskii]KTC87654.1 putative TrbI protein [Legionella drozanskii LLAP-1]